MRRFTTSASRIPSPKVFTLLVLFGVIVIKEILFRFVSREADSVESSAVRADAWHHRSDAISSVAAAIGISMALIGGEKFAWADDAAAIAAAGVIAWNGWRLLRPTLDDLMDTAPDRKIGNEIQRLAEDRFPAWRAWKNVSSARWVISFMWTCTWRWTRK